MEAEPNRDLSDLNPEQALESMMARLGGGEIPVLGERPLETKDPNARLVYSSDERSGNGGIASTYAAELAEIAHAPGLNDEETQMLTLLARGFSVAEIAESRGMSEGFAAQLLGIAADKASDNEWVKRNLFGEHTDSTKTKGYIPQEQVVNWMDSLRSTVATPLDLRFTMGKLTTWKLHHETVNGSGLAWFVRPVSEDADPVALKKSTDDLQERWSLC